MAPVSEALTMSMAGTAIDVATTSEAVKMMEIATMIEVIAVYPLIVLVIVPTANMEDA